MADRIEAMAAPPSHAYSVPAYIGAGGIATGAHYATTIAAVELGHAWPVAASAGGFLVGAVVKYLLNYTVAFRSRHAHAETGVRFVLVLAALLAANAAIFWLLNARLGMNYMVSQVLTTGALIAPGYFANRRWVFVRC